ncbi:MAG: hypothetical protein LH645_12895 [Actinomycetia bacterium]|nr:hypothetical protein [Actinomycetes bacterium]
MLRRDAAIPFDLETGPEAAVAKLQSNDTASLVLVDDYSLSGKQARTVLQAWFGLALDLPEEHGIASQQTEVVREVLRSRGFSLVFAYASAEAVVAVEALMSEIGLPGSSTVRSLVPAETVARIDLDDSSELTAFLKAVGDSLLQDKNAENPGKWTPELIASRALGYGNRGMLITFFYTVPTSMVTALWKFGRFRSSDWLPLFPRSGERVRSRQPTLEGGVMWQWLSLFACRM